MSEKNLTPIDQWNREKAAKYRAQFVYPQLNGLACPKCGKELQDMDCMMLASNPPQRNVNCSDNPTCDYRGYRVA